MLDRRNEIRMLCADLVDIQWKDNSGKTKTMIANLEDISLCGACLQTDTPIPVGTALKITYPRGGFEGKVKHCLYREIGYFVGLEFEPEFQWSLRKFKPQHFLDPRRLLSRAIKGVKRQTPLSQ